MIDSNTKTLHLRRVRNYFAAMPPLQANTVDIVLRQHLAIPEELMEAAREEVRDLQEDEPGDQRKSA